MVPKVMRKGGGRGKGWYSKRPFPKSCKSLQKSDKSILEKSRENLKLLQAPGVRRKSRLGGKTRSYLAPWTCSNVAENAINRGGEEEGDWSRSSAAAGYAITGRRKLAFVHFMHLFLFVPFFLILFLFVPFFLRLVHFVPFFCKFVPFCSKIWNKITKKT